MSALETRGSDGRTARSCYDVGTTVARERDLAHHVSHVGAQAIVSERHVC